MLITLTLALLASSASGPSGASGLTDYPVFRRPAARIEAVIDRGPIQELIVKCGGGTAILSYSKVEKLYCDPKLRCHRNLGVVVAQTCGKG